VVRAYARTDGLPTDSKKETQLFRAAFLNQLTTITTQRRANILTFADQANVAQ